MSIDNKQDIDSWCQIVLDLLDLTFAEKELFETWTPVDFITITKWSPYTSMVILIIFIPWTFLHYFFNERGNRWTIGETGQLAEFMEYSRYFQDLPKPRYPSQHTQATLTQETKKVWTLQPKPSHTRGAECEEQHRQGAAVQPYPVIT